MKKSEAFDSSLKKVFDECCEGEGWEIKFNENIPKMDAKLFSNLGMSDDYQFGIKVCKGDEILTIPDWDGIKSFISSLLAKQQEENQKIIDGIFEIKEKELARQREEFVKLLESKYSEPCDCIGEKYNCEHWGRHELLDELLLADIKSKLNKEEPAYIGGVNLTTNDNEISSRLAVTDKNIDQLRQWLNEKDPERMVTNRDIKDWLDIK
jgi:hypothetical protein